MLEEGIRAVTSEGTAAAAAATALNDISIDSVVAAAAAAAAADIDLNMSAADVPAGAVARPDEVETCSICYDVRITRSPLSYSPPRASCWCCGTLACQWPTTTSRPTP